MKKSGRTLIAALAVGLLAGSAVGVVAQDPVRMAPVEVTGTDVEGSCPGGPSTMDGPIEKNRGYVCQHTWSMSDPRLDGTFTRAWNLDFYRDGSGLDFGYATGRLETADGAWQMRPGLRGGIAGEPDPSDVVELFVFDGEDDYEGLAAVVLKVNREDGVEVDPARLHGYIVDADYPPPDHLPSE